METTKGDSTQAAHQPDGSSSHDVPAAQPPGQHVEVETVEPVHTQTEAEQIQVQLLQEQQQQFIAAPAPAFPQQYPDYVNAQQYGYQHYVVDPQQQQQFQQQQYYQFGPNQTQNYQQYYGAPAPALIPGQAMSQDYSNYGSEAPFQQQQQRLYPQSPRLDDKDGHILTNGSRRTVMDKREASECLEKYLCCCCPKNKKHRMICGGVVLVVLITISVLLGLYFPRMPEISVFAIDLSSIGQSGSPYSFSYTDKVNPGLNNLNFQMNLSMTLGSFNPNSYDLNVQHMDLVARMMVNQSIVYDKFTMPLSTLIPAKYITGAAPTPPAGYSPSNSSIIGTASYGTILFPAKTRVNFTMVFLLNYTVDSNVGILHDPTILEIASSCGVTASSIVGRRPMKIHYDATSVIPSLSLFGSPSISNDIGIKCPFSVEQITAVVRAVQGGQDVMDALHNVFGGDSKIPPPPIVPDTPLSSSSSSSSTTTAAVTASASGTDSAIASTTSEAGSQATDVATTRTLTTITTTTTTTTRPATTTGAVTTSS
ncbi:UNVERIFIED_CONTAM: hypothetical protein HDU68_008409 [Siphonaria sp. JEL0065]|nr:hypothetical protein HDU68_008409 [Siphonaria sp. JEL0065]